MNLRLISVRHVSIRLYIFYCGVLIVYIFHRVLIKPQHALMQKSLSSKTLLNQFDVTVTVCDRKVIPTVLSQGRTTKEKERKIDNKVLVIIGHDQMNHVQTNNKLNAILHAMDYATDTNADLVLVRNGWPTKTLEVLFNHDYQNDSHSWEQQMEQILNLRFVNQNDLDEIIIEVTDLYIVNAINY